VILLKGDCGGEENVEFGVLGPLQVRHAGEALPLGTPQQQLVLVLLVVNLGRAASLEGIIYELWGESPPPSAVAKVRGYAAALRRLFASVDPGVDRVVRAGSGYLLRVDGVEVDLWQFSEDVSNARRALAEGDLPAAQEGFARALQRWRGTMLDGLPRGPLIASRCSTVEQDRLAVIDNLAGIHLRQGQPAQASALLWPQVHDEPLREQSYALLLRARYQLDGVAGALEVFETLRRNLAEQLGIEPGAELQRLHRAVLTRDSALDLPEPPHTRRAPAPPIAAAAVPRPRPEPTIDWAGSGRTSGAPEPCTLPPDLPDFVGRRPEARLLRNLLVRGAGAGVVVVAIAGRGGVGKTALGVHVAHRLLAAYPDGQIYVDLRGLDRERAATPYEVLGRLLRLLGVGLSQVSGSVAVRAEQYRDLLARRRVLLVLDNVASDHQIRSLIPAGHACAVIAISRARIGASFGANLLDLDVLDAPTASGLLANLAGRNRTEAEPGAVAELAELCGHLPLALRIAGGRLAARPHWSVGQLVQLLRDESARLDQLSHDHLDLRSSIALSYHNLAQEAQRLFRRLGALDVSEISSQLSAPLLDRSVAQAETVLEQLIDARLVQVTGRDPGGGLRCHLDDLVRLFASECAEREERPDQLAAARVRVFGTCLSLVEGAARSRLRPGRVGPAG
jgi:DNA-binding SARP family transcriptional activator